MGYTMDPHEADPLADGSGFHSSAWLIRVSASEQQAPGALCCCPVCGQPYPSERSSALPPLAEDSAGERRVFLCERCQTYSVGQLDARDAAVE